MARTTPHVEQGTLMVGAPATERTIHVGTLAWFGWLESATAFTFTCPSGTFTARRERSSSGRGGWYWRAYLRRAGRLKRAYLGKAEELTLERLHAVAASLASPDVPDHAPDRPGADVGVPAGGSIERLILPTGTATFLFTDIEGSTQLWEQHPQAMQAALARHDSVLRQAIGAHGGVVFKTVGDSMHAAFARAADALAAALSAQRALHQEAWDSTGPLLVRMALHSGAAESRDGDYFGPPLNRLARILVLGHGGQILLSRATHDLVADDLPDQTTLRPLGEYPLRDLTRPEGIFQCVSADLPSDFPPLRSHAAHPDAESPMLNLLATKLYIPQAQPTLVARPRLLRQLAAGLAGKLTLIAAPAGFGKTTLLATWLRQLQIADCRLQIMPTDNLQSTIYNLQSPCVAWLSLDPTDNDATTFLRYLITALQTIAPEIGTTALVLLRSPQPPAPKAILATLINDVHRQPTPIALVLDDYHTITTEIIHEAMAFLIDHMPPHMHLVIISRADPPLPLARLRARQQMLELRAEDLRFTSDEAAAFLNQTMGLTLSAEQIVALEARTEGWIAGLQLAALSMQGQHDVASSIAAFTGSHRFVLDYLTDEVVQRQSEAVQQFLLHTCILERLCGSLCDAVLGVGTLERWNVGTFELANVQTAYSQLILEQLERANLFLVPLDNNRQWYRYHHLFAQMLQNRLERRQADLIPQLHRRASEWFEHHGLQPEAVQHALAAGDSALAARLIEPLARPMQQRGEMTTIMSWLAALPEEVLRARPRLGLIYAWGLATTGQLPAAEHWLQDVEHGLAFPDEDGSLLGEITAIRARIALIQGHYGHTLELARQALASLPEDQVLLRALTNVSLGSACIGVGDLDAASQSFVQASALYQATGHLDQALLPLRQLARVLIAQGRLNQLDQVTQEALRLAAECGQRSPLVGYTYLSLGQLSYERNDLAAAGRYFADGLALVELGGARDVLNLMNLVDAHLALARLKQTQGDQQGALELTQRITPIWEQLARALGQRSGVASPTPSERQAEPGRSQLGVGTLYADRIAACRVWLWLSQDDIAAASQWAQSWEWNPEGEITYFQETRLTALARVLIAQGECARALALLARLLSATEAVGKTGQGIELLALQALAQHAHGQEPEALITLERALALAEPEGYIRTFVDEGAPMAALLQDAQVRGIMPLYVEKLLAAFPNVRFTIYDLRLPEQPQIVNRKSEIVNPLVEPLTDRELQVLRLIAAGASNQAIADRLVITLHTVKKHAGVIFDKLGVTSRTEAVAKARELRIM